MLAYMAWSKGDKAVWNVAGSPRAAVVLYRMIDPEFARVRFDNWGHAATSTAALSNLRRPTKDEMRSSSMPWEALENPV